MHNVALSVAAQSRLFARKGQSKTEISAQPGHGTGSRRTSPLVQHRVRANFTRSHGSLAAFIISLDLAANLTAAEVRRVHVRVRQTVAHGPQGRSEVACENALVHGAGNVRCCDSPGDGSMSRRRAGWLAPAAA